MIYIKCLTNVALNAQHNAKAGDIGPVPEKIANLLVAQRQAVRLSESEVADLRRIDKNTPAADNPPLSKEGTASPSPNKQTKTTTSLKPADKAAGDA